jgi:hypothetical protein
MTYWTALVITILSGPFADREMMLIYPSLAECRAAGPIVSDTLSYDHKLRCVESNSITASLRPQARP